MVAKSLEKANGAAIESENIIKETVH